MSAPWKYSKKNLAELDAMIAADLYTIDNSQPPYAEAIDEEIHDCAVADLAELQDERDRQAFGLWMRARK